MNSFSERLRSDSSPEKKERNLEFERRTAVVLQEMSKVLQGEKNKYRESGEITLEEFNQLFEAARNTESFIIQNSEKRSNGALQLESADTIAQRAATIEIYAQNAIEQFSDAQSIEHHADALVKMHELIITQRARLTMNIHSAWQMDIYSPEDKKKLDDQVPNAQIGDRRYNRLAQAVQHIRDDIVDGALNKTREHFDRIALQLIQDLKSAKKQPGGKQEAVKKRAQIFLEILDTKTGFNRLTTTTYTEPRKGDGYERIDATAQLREELNQAKKQSIH